VNKNQKERIHWVGWDSLLYRKVQCGPQSMWNPGGHSLFFWRFLGSDCWSISSCWSTAALRSDHSLLFGTEVQLVVSCTAIEAQIVFETLLVLVTGQLAIAGQLGREVHSQNIRLFLGSRGQRWFQGGLGRWGHWRCVCLILGDHSRTEGESFSLLLRVRLKDLFLYLSCMMVVFMVTFPVVVIDSHC